MPYAEGKPLGCGLERTNDCKVTLKAESLKMCLISYRLFIS